MWKVIYKCSVHQAMTHHTETEQQRDMWNLCEIPFAIFLATGNDFYYNVAQFDFDYFQVHLYM